ncbi:MAG: Lactate 2-monooxygenase [Ktedonobacterales bacterium]|nr:MAG: Lactate 2-monooxygenase [Ktedonobacterales bacterium]
MSEPFWKYQSEIYDLGVSGVKPGLSTDATKLEVQARENMSPGAYWFVAGGAGTGATMRANREAFYRWRIVPRMLRGATVRSLARTVLGTYMPAPVLVAPIGIQNVMHPDGELATARAASSLGIPLVLSTTASRSIEEVAAACGDGPRWFQLYWPNDEQLCLSMLRRAESAGFTTLVVTIDCWSLGWRPNDLDGAYPAFNLGVGSAIPFTDPVFLSQLDAPPTVDLVAAVKRWSEIFNDVDRTWQYVEFLRRHWGGPMVLKGIQHPDDALFAIDVGADGIVVSNHGGRQVDGAVGSLDVLPDIVRAVGDRLEVLFDSGIRSGSDIFKALALGARAVLVGRPVAFGLGQGGERGVRHVLRSLLADFDLTVGLSGYRNVDEIGPNALSRSA